MAEKEIPFRQIHLDFHTSEAIEGVCSEFDAEEFAQMNRMPYISNPIRIYIVMSIFVSIIAENSSWIM